MFKTVTVKTAQCKQNFNRVSRSHCLISNQSQLQICCNLKSFVALAYVTPVNKSVLMTEVNPCLLMLERAHIDNKVFHLISQSIH